LQNKIAKIFWIIQHSLAKKRQKVQIKSAKKAGRDAKKIFFVFEFFCIYFSLQRGTTLISATKLNTKSTIEKNFLS